MYLVDTSVWIDYFIERKNSAVQFLEEILNNNLPYGITGFIYQEILQGVVSPQDFKNLSDYLLTQRFFHPKHAVVSYELAAKIFFACRRRGLTIRSTIDCMTAQIAVEHGLIILHNDRDFKHIKKIIPELKLVPLK